MDKFTAAVFNELVKTLTSNPYDLSNFVKALSDRYYDFNETDIDEIKDFLSLEMTIECDDDICLLDDESVEYLGNYINQILMEIYDDE